MDRAHLRGSSRTSIAGIVRDASRELDPLPHAFTVSGNFSLGRLDQIHTLNRLPRPSLAIGMRISKQSSERIDKIKAGQPFWKRIELRRVSHQLEQPFGIIGRGTEHARISPRVGRTRPVIR